eukprot:Blabericola_migrator_1__9117@NODE_4872_length_950_cov_74_078143_g3048_i0_p2_GENE_NODE_4872_length_950_cov_74_078143_g3048_i0NODE_4872_length_950_cov_74_078143_g3048_i0_p2_ORF_typecomplete_len119_score26_12MIF/PF01187_18/2_8e34Tautomerase/PF01361_21/0_1Tautomerase/PF01361_21/0_0065Tautomerase_2/PF14552_6/3_2e03Tautomerase_2/PF14552_6/0_14_NODE_4872_length_950_cov_74_078143_g3048_i071427
MPILTINTNVPVSKIPSDLVQRAAAVVAETLGKSQSRVAVHILGDQLLSRGGTNEPTALCQLVSIGALSKESNSRHSAAISRLLEDTLKIAPSNVMIEFRDVDKAYLGFDGSTVAALT